MTVYSSNTPVLDLVKPPLADALYRALSLSDVPIRDLRRIVITYPLKVGSYKAIITRSDEGLGSRAFDQAEDGNIGRGKRHT
jgi:hypothetical protein